MKVGSWINLRFQTLNSWIHLNLVSLGILKVRPAKFQTFQLRISLPLLNIPRQLLVLQLVRILHVLYLPGPLIPSKRTERKRVEKAKKTGGSEPSEISHVPPEVRFVDLKPEGFKEISPSPRIELSALQHLVEIMSVPPLAAALLPAEEQTAGKKSRSDFPLESMTWVRPFFRKTKIREGTSTSEKSEVINTVLDQVTTHQIIRKAPINPVNEAISKSAGEPTREENDLLLANQIPSGEYNRFPELHDFTPSRATEQSYIPIFLDWEGLSDFFGLPDSTLLLASVKGVSVPAELESVAILSPMDIHAHSVRGTRSSSRRSISQMQKLSAEKTGHFGSELHGQYGLGKIPDISSSDSILPLEEEKKYTIWKEDLSPINWLLQRSIGENGGILAGISAPGILPAGAGRRRQIGNEIVPPQSIEETAEHFAHFQDFRNMTPAKEVQGYSPAVSGKEHPITGLEYASAFPYLHALPFLIDIPLLAIHKALTVHDETFVSMASPHIGRRRIDSLSLSQRAVFEVPENKDVGLVTERFAVKTYSNLPSGLFPADILNELLPITGLALVRIGMGNNYFGVTGVTSPYGISRQVWPPHAKKKIDERSVLFGPVGGSSISPYLPTNFAETLGRTETMFPFAPTRQSIESRYDDTSIFARPVQKLAVRNIVESFQDDIEASSLIPAAPTLEEYTEIPTGLSSFMKTDLELRAEQSPSQDEVDLEELRSIKRSIQIIMNEQLRKYGFDT